MTNERIKEPFSFSKLNGILLVLLGLAYPLYFVVLKRDFSPYNLGVSLGSIVGSIIIPIFFGLIAWLVSGKRAHIGQITLNVFVGLMFFSLFGQIGSDIATYKSSSTGLSDAMEEYRTELRTNGESSDSSYKKISGTVKSELNNLIRKSRGKEREAYKALNAYFTLSDSIMSGWQEAYGETMEEGILDFSKLTTDSACIAQKNTFRRFVNKSIDYKRFVKNRVDIAHSKVDSLGFESDFTKMMLSKIEQTNEIQSPILVQYLTAYIEYSKRSIGLIDLMQKNNDEWYYVGEELYINDDDVLEQFNASIDTMTEMEDEINGLFRDIIETI